MAERNAARRAVATLVDFLYFYIPYLVSISDATPEPVRIVFAFGSLAVLGMQAGVLSRDGQTFGKKMTRLRVVRRETGENGGFVTNVLIRALSAWVPNLILVAAGMPPMWLIADGAVLLWRADGLSLHDLIAGTKVVVLSGENPS